MQDYAAEKWKISVANKGYTTGEDGRALKLNQVTFNQGRTSTRKPNEPSNNEKNIALNIKNALTGSSIDIKNNLFSVPVNVTFSQVTTKGVNFKNTDGKPYAPALSKNFTGGKTLTGIQFKVGGLVDSEGKKMADTEINYDFSLLEKSNVSGSNRLSLEHYLIDKYGPGNESIIREQIQAEADRRKNYWVTNVYKSNPDNKDKTEDEATTAYRLALKQLRPN